MNKGEETESEKFLYHLYTVLMYAMDTAIHQDWGKDADETLGYFISDHFKTMADKVNSISRMNDYYEGLDTGKTSPLNYALTGKIEDLSPHIQLLYKEDLQKLKEIIDKELEDENRGF